MKKISASHIKIGDIIINIGTVTGVKVWEAAQLVQVFFYSDKTSIAIDRPEVWFRITENIYLSS